PLRPRQLRRGRRHGEAAPDRHPRVGGMARLVSSPRGPRPARAPLAMAAAARSVPAPRPATARAAPASRLLLGPAPVRGPLRPGRAPALLPRPEASGGQADGLRRLAAEPRGRADDCLQQRERRRELRRRALSGLDRDLRLPRLVARGSTLPPGCG